MFKVLLLEDCKADADLTVIWLRKEAQVTVVPSRDAFLEAISQKNFELIISDYAIPSWSALEAIAEARKRVPHIPFMILSGTLTDEMIPALESANVDDVLLKDRPNRLPWAVRRAIRDRQTRVQLLQTQRIQVVGELTAGLVHDLRNMLTPVTGVLHLLEQWVPQDKKQLVLGAQRSALRITEMTDRMLLFVSGKNGYKGDVSLKLIILEFLQFLPAMLGSGLPVESQINTSAVLPLDPTLIRQVVLNFAINAADAGASRIWVVAQDVTLDNYTPRTEAKSYSGRFCVIGVRDNGSGIPPEVMAKMFQPFYTTKPPDKGTGLGLSTVRNIVGDYGGFVDVYSMPNEGSSFSAYFRLPDTAQLTGTDLGGESVP